MTTSLALTIDEIREAICDLPSPGAARETVLRRQVTTGAGASRPSRTTLVQSTVVVEFTRVVSGYGLAWRFVGRVRLPTVPPSTVASAPAQPLIEVGRLLGERCLSVTGDVEGATPELVIDFA